MGPWVKLSLLLLLPIPIFLLADRILSRATYEVHALGATSAEVVVCDRNTKMKRDGIRFVATVPIDCEGTGEIYVHYPNSAPVVCVIGYVSSGIHDDANYVVENSKCEWIRECDASETMPELRCSAEEFEIKKRFNDERAIAAAKRSAYQ
jgi:hypothetical protein